MREMRRKDRMMSADDTIQVLKDGDYGVLATVCEDGKPYSVPLSYVYDEAKNAIYIHCSAAGGQKIDNIRYNSNACFTVVSMAKIMPELLSTFFKSVNVTGTVEIVEDDAEKRHALMSIVKKYASDFMEDGAAHMESGIARTAILKIYVDQLTGKERLKK